MPLYLAQISQDENTPGRAWGAPLPGAVGVPGRNITQRLKVFKFFKHKFPVRLDVEVSPFFGAGCDL